MMKLTVGQRALGVGRAGCSCSGHLEQGVGTSLGFGASSELGDIDVALAEPLGRLGPVASSNSRSTYQREDLEELGPADVVEGGMQASRPRRVDWCSDRRCDVARFRSAFSAAPIGSASDFAGERPAFELVERHVHRVAPSTATRPSVSTSAGDTRVGGDPGHHPGLGDADLPARRARCSSTRRGAAQLALPARRPYASAPDNCRWCFIHAFAVKNPWSRNGWAASRWSATAMPAAAAWRRSCSTPGRPRRDGGRASKPVGSMPLEQRQTLSAVLDHRLPSTRRPAARRRWRRR